jgi:hypothetical protein
MVAIHTDGNGMKAPPPEWQLGLIVLACCLVVLAIVMLAGVGLYMITGGHCG